MSMRDTCEDEYKGNPMISLDPDGKYPFSFGLNKAKKVLQNIDAIKAFVAKHDKPTATPAPKGWVKV